MRLRQLLRRAAFQAAWEVQPHRPQRSLCLPHATTALTISMTVHGLCAATCSTRCSRDTLIKQITKEKEKKNSLLCLLLQLPFRSFFPFHMHAILFHVLTFCAPRISMCMRASTELRTRAGSVETDDIMYCRHGGRLSDGRVGGFVINQTLNQKSN